MGSNMQPQETATLTIKLPQSLVNSVLVKIVKLAKVETAIYLFALIIILNENQPHFWKYEAYCDTCKFNY